MNNNLGPLLPAFTLLWNSAKSENQKHAEIDNIQNGNRNYGSSTKDNFANKERASPSNVPYDSKSQCSGADSICEDNEKKHSVNDESVVVCTLECDQGAKFVRQIVYDGTNTAGLSGAEDLFVDWLNCELTSQRAQIIIITVYLCRVPISTCSYGICSWLENLRAEGKAVDVTIKIASIGRAVTRYINSRTTDIDQRNGCMQENSRRNDTEDDVEALKKLAKMEAKIEPFSAGDWVQLISLLTDRASLHALDIKDTPSAVELTKMLQDTL